MSSTIASRLMRRRVGAAESSFHFSEKVCSSSSVKQEEMGFTEETIPGFPASDVR